MNLFKLLNRHDSRLVYKVCVGGSSKIHDLCHMTQVLLKMKFTSMETLSGYFLHLRMCAGILLTMQRVLATPTLIGT